ncbi:MAG: histidinol-phosphatase HisJ family protein [candidate division Zixibacteria bacterium]|nr:histidinol-phosphatase HisJ family protein [candidate division Zixibacteria bacterium]
MIKAGKADFHVHPQYSIDAQGSIPDYCERALSLGLEAICFTTHIDLNPARDEVDPFIRIDGEIIRVTPESLAIYYNDVMSAKGKYAKRGLDVYPGIELDYFEGVEEIWDNFNPGLDFAFTIGSVHCIEDLAFTYNKEASNLFGKHTERKFFERYYKSVKSLARSEVIDCIGHLDGYRKYARSVYPKGLDVFPIDIIGPALEAIRDSGKGIEINSSSKRHGSGTTYPSIEILELAAKVGVPIVSLGSDAHKPEGLGAGLEESARLIEELGLTWKPKL